MSYQVRTESLYGMKNFFFPDVDFLDKEEITIPRVVRDLLILVASLSLSPSVFACDCLSLPAKSTKFILLVILRGSFFLTPTSSV